MFGKQRGCGGSSRPFFPLKIRKIFLLLVGCQISSEQESR